MTNTTKKALLAKLNNAKALKTHPAPHIEDAPQIVAAIVDQLKAQGATDADIEICEDKVQIGSQFWLLPKHPRNGVEVDVRVNSVDVITTPKNGAPCHGSKTKWKVSDDGESLVFPGHSGDVKLTPIR